MDPDLVHTPSERSAENNAAGSIGGESLKLRVGLLAGGWDPTDPDLVADDLQALPALYDSPGIRCQWWLSAVSCILYLHRKFPFNSANIFLPHLSCSDLSFHLPSFARISPEHQQSRGETVQPRRIRWDVAGRTDNNDILLSSPLLSCIHCNHNYSLS